MTLLDYPDKVAATVFTMGCPFRCHFCHNPELVYPEKFPAKTLSEDEVLNFFRSRKKLLDAVCITGGEPTMHRDLPEFIAKVKDLGLSVKLDTNGTHPAMLESLLKKGWLDYIAMDIKAPWKKYSDVVGVKIDLEKLQQSVKIIMESGLPHEFRSTVLPRLHSRADIISMARQVRGARAYFLQQFRPVDNLVNDEFVTEKKYLMKDLEDIRREIKDWFKVCRVR